MTGRLAARLCHVGALMGKAGVPKTFYVVLAAALLVLSGCGGGSLPKSESVTTSPWKSFDAVMAAYGKIVPGRTSVKDLRDAGFDPYTTPNMRVLSYLDITRHFLTTDAITLDRLDPAVRDCILAREACLGYEVVVERIHHERVGSTFADLFNFRRETHETGWRFRALFVIQNSMVTYKLWSGVPRIDRTIDKDNPLGPVQEPAGLVPSPLP